jgi:hypothetical protein
MSDLIASLQRYVDYQAGNAAQIASSLSMSADDLRLLLERITQLEADNALLRAFVVAYAEWRRLQNSPAFTYNAEHEALRAMRATYAALDAAEVMER